ncbi:TonB-dependent receptor [Aquirhabdus sp.]|uniref:TonB-dependent receptor n=1 Tax=Aquirhabdus sp. TaxID=2824160 RepID=UPI00396CEAD3
MKQNRLSQSLRVIFTGSVSVGLGLMAAYAEDAVQRVEVTGSSIKGVAAQSTSPITVIKTADLAKLGITTASEALSSISAVQTQITVASNVGGTGGVGAAADMRGLGSSHTLVLLNGRRMPTSPNDGAAVDLNIIPLDALDRIEVLKDGASAIYGADAVAGVINFITKRSYQGLVGSVEGSDPTHSGGGSSTHFNITGGHGDLDSDGYNLFGVVDFQQQQPLSAVDRSFTSQGGIRPDLGLDSTSGNSFPANVTSAKDDIYGNPFGASCKPPFSNPAGNGTCRYNYPALANIVPQSKQFSFLGKGTLKLDENNKLGVEYIHAQSEFGNTSAADIAPAGTTIYGTSKYYPGNGITPGIDGVTGQPLSLNFRTVDAGSRQDESYNVADRLLFTADGTQFGWDYDGGIALNRSTAKSRVVAGYLNSDLIQQAVENGTLNPFGPQAAGDPDVYAASGLKGTFINAKSTSVGADFKISREIFQLPAGGVGFALGTSYRHEKMSFDYNRDITAVSNGLALQDANGREGSRDISAVFTELHVPILKTLEAQFAVRYDRYSDVGGSTNPKVSFRWEPMKEVMFRTSYSTGFRAPSLYELHSENTRGLTAGKYSDPVLCPGGVVAPNGVASRDCKQQLYQLTGGNTDLKPETSRSYGFGTVIQPVKDVTVSIDYFNVLLKHQVDTLSEADIFNDYEKYSGLYVRNPDGSLNYVTNTNFNLGNSRTSGVDFSFDWRLPETPVGRFNLSLDGTLVQSYKYQTEENGPYEQRAGVYAGTNPISRWRHTAGLNWKNGDWSAVLQQTFQTGYKDQNLTGTDGADDRSVGSYMRYNLSGTYSGFKNATLTLGVKNLFNKNPPATNQQDQLQVGYDPRYTDPLGRVIFLRGTYKFM